jgi:hypothetical protein
MSLWTPDGERPVRREPASSPADPSAQAAPGPDDLEPDERARAEAIAAEMAAVREQLQSVPAAVVVANHAMGLYELAAIHLGAQPPDFDEAQVAIDAYGALVDAVSERLGPDGITLRDALAQIRLAFVQIRAAEAGGAAPSEESSAT